MTQKTVARIAQGASFIGIFSVMVVAGCGGNGSDPSGTLAETGKASLRVIHLSAEAPTVDVFVDEGAEPAVKNLFFGQGTDYLQLDAGEHSFDISAAGRPAIESVLRAKDVTLMKDASYTIAAFGRLNELRGIALQDDRTEPPAGYFRVRAVHAAPNVGAVDIWNVPADGAPAPLIQGFDYSTASNSILLLAGAYTLGIDVDEDANPDLLFDLPSLPAGAIINLYAVSTPAGEVSLYAQLGAGPAAKITPRPEPAKIRVVHLSPDAPAVDVYANGRPVIAALSFEQSTDYLQVPSGSYDFDVAPAGTNIGAKVLSVSGLNLEPGKSYTAVAFDTVSSIRALALEDETMGPGSAAIHLRAIHTAAGVGEVDIWNIPAQGAPAIIVENLEFGEAGNYLELPPGEYTLGIDVNNDAMPDLTFALPALPAGVVANVFASRSTGGMVRLVAQTNAGTAMINARR